MRTPTAAAASRTRRAPSTLTRAISASSGTGSTTDARWTSTSAPASTGVESLRAMSTRRTSTPRTPPGRLAYIEADDLPIGGQAGQEPLGDQPGGSRDGDGGHVHRLTAWCTPLKATTISERRPGPARRAICRAFPGSPFEALGFPGLPGFPGFGAGGLDLTQLMGMLSSPGPVNWEIARQIARSVALEGGVERPADPAAPAEFAELARAAQTHVADLTGLAASLGAQVRVLGPSEWADLHLNALRPVLEALAITLGGAFQAQIELGDRRRRVPSATTRSPDCSRCSRPCSSGSRPAPWSGYLAHHALGRYDLPLPTADTPNLCFVARHIDDFETAWSLPRADLRFYLAVHEVVHAATRSVPWVRNRLVQLSTRVRERVQPRSRVSWSRGSARSTRAIRKRSRRSRPNPRSCSVRCGRQPRMRSRSGCGSSPPMLEGYADTILEQVARRLVPSYAQIHEAMQRHRIERGEAGQFIESLLGLDLGRDDYARGSAFCAGVIERAGLDGLNRLWTDETMVPTPAELEAPGLWLARIDLPDPRPERVSDRHEPEGRRPSACSARA